MVLKRLLVLAILSTVVAMAPLSTARAQDYDDALATLSCVARGTATTFSYSPVTGPGMHRVIDDYSGDLNPLNGDEGEGGESADPLNLSDADSGTFSFTSDAVTCAGADAGGRRIGRIHGTFYRLTFDGEYTSLVCGTGHIDGEATLSGHYSSLTARLGTTFAAGTGRATVGGADGYLYLNDRPSILSREDVDSGGGSGVVSIVPNAMDSQGSNCIDRTAYSFLVSVAFDVVLYGDAGAN